MDPIKEFVDLIEDLKSRKVLLGLSDKTERQIAMEWFKLIGAI